MTSELDNREAIYDFAIHSGNSVAMLVRISPVCSAPDDRYLLATAQHALLHGVEWVVLTNGIGWQVHHVEDTGKTRPETPIVLAFDLSHMQPGRDSYIETLFLLTREGHKSAGLNHFRLRLEVTNRHYLGAMMLSDPVVTAVRRELRKLNPVLQITPLEIRENLAKGVLRPDVAASSETAAVLDFLQKIKQDALEARRRAADPNRFSSRKPRAKKPSRANGLPSAVRHAGNLSRRSSARRPMTELFSGFPKRRTLKKCFDGANPPRPSRPAGGVF